MITVLSYKSFEANRIQKTKIPNFPCRDRLVRLAKESTGFPRYMR